MNSRAELTPEQENIDFLKSYIFVAQIKSLERFPFIRPCRAKRAELAEAAQNGTFEAVRSQIKLRTTNFLLYITFTGRFYRRKCI